MVSDADVVPPATCADACDMGPRRYRQAHRRWTGPLSVFLLLLVACPGDSRAPGPASPAPTVPTTTPPDAPPPSSSTPAPVPDEQALARARQRLFTAPPAIHGIYEVREANEPEPLRWELWVSWPSFRVETTFVGEPVVVVTEDGERFAYRQGDEVGTTDGVGEQGAILLAPILQFAGVNPPLPSCASERIVGLDTIAGCLTIHVACPDEGSETWIDSESGLVLSYFIADPGPGGETTSGYSSNRVRPGIR